jgi:hypothetical protein
MRHRVLVLLALLLGAAGAAMASGTDEENQFSSLGIDTVSVKAESLDVEVQGSRGPSVSMAAWIDGEPSFESQGIRIRHERSGSSLRVWVERTRLLFGAFARGRIELQVPRGTRLLVESVSGSISTEGCERAQLSLGSISGRISVRDSRGTLTISTVSGAVSLESVSGRIAARTISGSIVARRTELTDDASFSSISGRIDVDLDTALDRLRFDLSSVSGSITIGNIKTAKGLRMGSGPVTLTGRTVSGSQHYR